MKYLKYILALTLILAFALPSEAQKRRKKRRPSTSRKKSKRPSAKKRKPNNKRRNVAQKRRKTSSSGRRRRSGAKFTNKKQYWSIGGTANVMHYFGDIVPKSKATSTDIKFTKPDFGVFFIKRFHSRISFRGMVTIGSVAGDDFNSGDPNTKEGFARYMRNLHFRTSITEFTGTFMVDLFENKGVFYRRPKIPIPYFMVGIGGFIFNPQAQPPGSQGSGQWVDLQPLQTEGVAYSKFAIAIPFGLGVRYKLSSNVDLSLEIGWRQTNTDYIDDVSGFYPDLSTLSEDGKIYSMRALETHSALTGEAREMDALGLGLRSDGTRGVLYQGQNGDYYIPAGFYPKDNTLGPDFQVVDARGNPDKDVYLVTGFHISYIFSGGVRTPKFRR